MNIFIPRHITVISLVWFFFLSFYFPCLWILFPFFFILVIPSNDTAAKTGRWMLFVAVFSFVCIILPKKKKKNLSNLLSRFFFLSDAYLKSLYPGRKFNCCHSLVRVDICLWFMCEWLAGCMLACGCSCLCFVFFYF